MSSDARAVMELRRRTGLGVMECKSALQASDGDVDKAIDHLRRSSGLKAAKKADRVAAEGALLLKCADDGSRATLIEVNSETDFVARDEKFLAFAEEALRLAFDSECVEVSDLMKGELESQRQALVQSIGENIGVRRVLQAKAEDGARVGGYLHGNRRLAALVSVKGGDAALALDLAMHITALAPKVVEAADMPESVIAAEREVFAARAKDSGKPPPIVEKMVEGSVRKFLAEHSLLEQDFVKEPKLKVGDWLQRSGASALGFTRWEVGEGIDKKEANFAEEVAAVARGS